MTKDTPSEHPLDVGSTLEYLRSQARRPMTAQNLAREMKVDESRTDELEALLDRLVQQGKVVRNRNGAYGDPEKMNLVVGKLSAHPDGYGFVVSENRDEDLFVPGRFMGDALHGDRVVARIEHRRRSGKYEGRIIRILERARHRLVGKLERSKGGWWVEPLDAKLGPPLHVPDDRRQGAEPGTVVVAEIIDYPKGGRAAEAEVAEVLGDPKDSRIDVEIVIREFELRHDFPDEVLAEAKGVPDKVTAAEIEGRTDFRDVPIVTIDGESAKDFDDAVYVEMLPTGNYRLHVHIADVSHYVAADSAIEREARERATSVYFPGRVLPMLPEPLSNEICSLKPGVDRLVQSVLIDIDRTGKTVNYELHDGVIRSAGRMTYRAVAGVLGGDEELINKHEEHRLAFERMRELAELLMEHRQRRGSIDFDLPEPEVIIDMRGETEDIVRAERNIAHRIIEEFMIRANEIVASHLTWEGVKSLYRVHEGPDPERVEAFREFISGLGHGLGGGDEPRPSHFMDLLERVQGRPEERVISLLMLRTMKQARYQVENAGHFGLASQMYTHFTSPIRRYPDLVVHRLLRADRGSEEAAPFDVAALEAELEQIGATSSERERRAEAAEREYVGWKKVQFMADKLGDVYEGHIVTVRSFGFFVELEPVFVEGLVPVSSLRDDYYKYDEAKHRLVGENTKRTLALGDRVKVRVAKVDMERRQIDFALEEGPLELPAPPPSSRRRSRRKDRGSRRGASAAKTGQDKGAQDKSEGDADKRDKDGRAAAGAGDESTSKERRGRRRRRSRGRKRGRRGSSGSKGESKRAASGDGGEQKTSGGGRQKGKEQRARSRQGKSKDSRSRDRDRDRGRRSRNGGPAAVRPAPQRAEQPTSKKEPEPKGEQPQVNPYLTDVDL